MSSRAGLFVAFVVLIGIVIAALALVPPRDRARSSWGKGPAERLPSLEGVAGWLNGRPLTADSLTGPVVVLVVWTDADPRSLDVLPEVQVWHDAYARYGVRFVGVHVPEYSFATDRAVPAAVARRLRLTFPIALDPDHRIRGRVSLGSGYPVLLVGIDGRIVFRTSGGRLAGVEGAVRDELRRLRPDLGFPSEPAPREGVQSFDPPPARVVPLGTQSPIPGPLADAVSGRTQTYTTQFRFQEEGQPYTPYPVGRWTSTSEGLIAARGGASDFVAIRSGGDHMNLVMIPPRSAPTRVWILADDDWIAEPERGPDVRADPRGASYVEVDAPRLYRIARSGKEHVYRISPEEPGVTICSFVFEAVRGTAGSAAVEPRPGRPPAPGASW